MSAVSRRHVEIMRDDLSEIFYDATRGDVEYIFGDSVAAVGDDGQVRFEHGSPRRFDLVIGADGLHSTIRRLVFGPESDYTAWIGGYIAVASVPDDHHLRNSMLGITGIHRLVGVYRARHMTDARAFFLSAHPLHCATTTVTRPGRNNSCERHSATWAARCPTCSTRQSGPAPSTSTRSPNCACTPGHEAA